MEFRIVKKKRNINLENILAELDSLYEDLDYYGNDEQYKSEV